MNDNLIVKIAKDIAGNDIKKENIRKLLPNSYKEIKQIAEERVTAGKCNLAEERLIKLTYEIAADLVKAERLDIKDDQSFFAKKVKLALAREGDPGFLKYDNALSLQQIEESIQGYCKEEVDGRKYWRINKSLIYHKKFTLELLDPQQDEKILDLGCGHGSFVVYCSMLGANCAGIDYSPLVVQSANNYLKAKGLKGEIKVGDVEFTGFTDNTFDKIISCDLYEHLTSNSKAMMLKEAYRILKPGGFLLIKTPNLSYLRISLFFKRLLSILKFKNPFKVKIPHTKDEAGDEKGAVHIGLTTLHRLERDFKKSNFFTYQFYYSLGTKFDRRFPRLNRLVTTEIPFVRDYCVEEIVVKATKSKLANFLPD